MELNCSDISEFRKVNLKIMTSVSSIIDNEDEFNMLWSKAIFQEKVEELLSLLFDVPIIVKIYISNIDQEMAGSFRDEYVYLIIASFIVFIAFTLFCVLYQRRKRAKELRLLTVYINNPLVITLGIGQYDKFPGNSDIQNTIYPDLIAVDMDQVD